jgi:sugar lactone lactonase YvrE
VKHSGALLAILLAAACARKEAAPAADSAAAAAPPAPERVTTVSGLSTPESVLWDAAKDVWYVSNINGSPVARDGNGFISRLTRDGTVDSLHFIAGGRNGVTLNGPKGMALVGDTLWVTDIDAVRGFNRNTGAPVATVEFGSRARFLNDMTAAPDGTLYITDSGLAMDDKGQMTHPGPDRIFALRGRAVSIAAEGPWLEGPNGITWDQAGGRFVVVPFGGKELLGWHPSGSAADTIGTGPGTQDGVEFLGGELLVTSWADSTVFTVTPAGVKPVVTGVPSPADIGVDQVRGLVAIPLFLENRVEIWRVR